MFSSVLITGKRHYEEEPCRGHVHRRSTLTVCPVSRIPGCCRIYVKGIRLVLAAATPHLTTANSSECANRGIWCFVTTIFAFYISTCVHLHVYTATTMLLDTWSTKSPWLPRPLMMTNSWRYSASLTGFSLFFVNFNQYYVFFQYKHVKPIMLLQAWNDYTFRGSLQFDFCTKFIEVTWYWILLLYM